MPRRFIRVTNRSGSSKFVSFLFFFSLDFLSLRYKERVLIYYYFSSSRAIADIRHLVEKYPDGLDGYDGERPAGA